MPTSTGCQTELIQLTPTIHRRETTDFSESHTCGFRLISKESRTTSRSSQKTKQRSHSGREMPQTAKTQEVSPSLQQRTWSIFVSHGELPMKLSVKTSQFSARTQMTKSTSESLLQVRFCVGVPTPMTSLRPGGEPVGSVPPLVTHLTPIGTPTMLMQTVAVWTVLATATITNTTTVRE